MMNQTIIRAQTYRRALEVVLRLSVGVLFLYSSFPKISQPYSFLGDIYRYGLTSPAAGLFIAVVLPWIEFILGVLLLVGLLPGGALATAAVLCLVFVVAQSSALARGLRIPCGCFGGSDSSPLGLGTLLRTLALFFVATLAFCLTFVERRGSRGHGADAASQPVREDS